MKLKISIALVISIFLIFHESLGQELPDYVEKNSTDMIIHNYKGDAVMLITLYYLTPQVANFLFEGEQATQMIEQQIEKKANGAFYVSVYAHEDHYFYPNNFRFIQNYFTYPIDYSQVTKISDIFSGRILKNTNMDGIIPVPDKLDLSQKIEVVYENTRKVLNLDLAASESKEGRLAFLKKRKQELEEELEKINAEILKLEKNF